MPPRNSEQPVNNDMILGELRGQVRELVHGVNNLNGKFDGLTREVIALGPLAGDIQQLKADVAELKATASQQTGGYEVVKAILNSPVVLSILVGVAFVIAAVKGWFK